MNGPAAPPSGGGRARAAAVDYAYDGGGRRRRERRGILQADGTIQATRVVRHYSDLYEVTTTLTASAVTSTARKYYVAGGLLIASRELPAPAYLQVALGGADGGPAYAAAASGAGEDGGAVAPHVAFGASPLARVTLAPAAASPPTRSGRRSAARQSAAPRGGLAPSLRGERCA